MDKSKTPEDSKESLRKSSTTTVAVMACTLATRLLGFIRNAVVAALFGTSGQADVLMGVFNIPNIFRKLLAEGALSAAFIPILSHSLVMEPDGDAARRLVRHIVSFLFILIIPLLILSVFFARPIVGIFLNLPDPELMSLSASLFRYLCHYLLFVSLSAVLMAVLNSHGIFIIPALTPLFFSIAVIASLLLFYRQLGIFAMAVGVLGGGLFQVIFQFPFFRRHGYDFIPDLRFSQDEFRKVMKLWLPVVATSSAFAVNQLVAVRFASALEPGSVSALGYALVIFQLPFGVFSASITTVLFPRMSRQAASGDREGLTQSLSYGLRFLFLVLIPSIIFFIILGKEIVGVIYQRGEFSPEDTLITARILCGYSCGMLSVGIFTFFQRFFYSVKDYKTPLIIALSITALDVALSLWLRVTALRVGGLAVANSAASTVGLALMVYFAYRRLGNLDGRKVFSSLFRILVSLVIPTMALLYCRYLSGKYLSLDSPWSARLLILLGGFIIFVLLSLAFYFLTRIEIVRDILKRNRS